MHSFSHAGDLGDIIYSLYVMKRLGGGELLLGTDSGLGEFQPRVGVTMGRYNSLVTLLRFQPYCKHTTWLDHVPFVTHQRNLNRFRLYWRGDFPFNKSHNNVHLIEMMCKAASIEFVDNGPWIEAAARRTYPIIINRTERQKNHKFPWRTVLEAYHGRVGFVGTGEEYDRFVHTYARVPYVPTNTVLALAEVINGSDLFIGNSSLALALAVAQGKRSIYEVSLETTVGAHTRSVFACQTDWRENFELPEV